MPDPNGVFADIVNIRRAQQEAGRLASESEESEESDVSESEEEEVEDCIVANR